MAWQPHGNPGWGWVPPPVASAPQFAPPVAQFAPPVAQFAPPAAQYVIPMPEYRGPPRFQNDGGQRGRSPNDHDHGHHNDRRGSWHESPPHRHRDSSPGYWQNEQLRKEVEDLRRDKERKDEEERIKKDMLMKIALKEKRDREEQDRAKVIGKQAVADFKRKEAEEKEKKRLAEEKNEEEYRKRLQRDLGLSETQVSRIVKTDHDKAIDLRRTTHTRIARRHISIETLRAFGLPFKLDDGEPDHFVLVKRWVPQHEQDQLWDHTRRVREDRDARMRRLELKRDIEEAKAAKLILARKKEKNKAGGGLFGLF